MSMTAITGLAHGQKLYPVFVVVHQPHNTDRTRLDIQKVLLQIPYIRTDHEEANTMEACHKIDSVLDILICKNLNFSKISLVFIFRLDVLTPGWQPGYSPF